MLTLLIAMAVAAEPPRVVTLPKRARPVATVVRKRTVRKAPVRRARSAKLCVTGSCMPVAGRNYRLTGEAGSRFNGKLDVIAKQSEMACGVQGAPVCPANGARLVRTNID